MKTKITLFTTLAFLGLAAPSKAQVIPNGSFETWATYTDIYGSYNYPTGWSCSNISTYSTGITGLTTCVQGTTGAAAGTSFLKLTLIDFPLAGTILTAWSFSTTNLSAPTPALFPVSTRPANLTGKWQYKSTGMDTMMVEVFVTKWNTSTLTSDVIGQGTLIATGGTASTWTNFTVPITYTTGATPDSAGILIFAGSNVDYSTNVANDYLYIDDLQFSGIAPAGIDELNDPFLMTLAPNPFSTQTTITFAKEQKNAIVTLMDVVGKEIKQFYFSGTQLIIEKNELSNGIYFLKINDEVNSSVKKIVIQ